ncbi:MAG: hypothetical protein AAFZ01_08940 [Pseudomonadota bacterium]
METNATGAATTVAQSGGDIATQAVSQLTPQASYIATVTPNTFVLLGLLFLAYGLCLLAFAMTRQVHEARSDYARQVHTTAARSSTIMFAMPLVLAGLALMAAAQFYTGLAMDWVALAMLGLTGYLIVYACTGDWIADKAAAIQTRNEHEPAVRPAPVRVIQPVAA